MSHSFSSPRPIRLGAREVYSYALGAVGSNVIYALVAVYLLYFYTESFGLKAAAVGTLLLVVRVWDGVMDVIMGILVDNTKTRWGKFRPYLLFGGFLTGLAAAACFLSPNLSDSGKLIYAYCTYIVWSMSYTICDIPFWSLTPAMTDDTKERTRIVSISRTGAQFGFWIVYVGALPAVGFFGGNWALVGVLAGVICTACFIVAFFGVRERIIVPRSEPQTPRTALHFFRSNGPLCYLMLACLLLETVSNIRGAFAPFFFKYYLGNEGITILFWRFANESLVGLFMFSNITFVIVGCLTAPFIAERFGKVSSALYAYIVVGLATVAMYFAGPNIPLLILFTVIAGYFDGVSNIARMSCLADCVEYGEWKTGNRAEGLVFSANVFKTKVASGLAGAIPAYLLALIAYMPPMRIHSAAEIPANALSAPKIPAGGIPAEGILVDLMQAPGTVHWMFLFFTVIMGAASILAILPLFKYKLTEERFAKIVEELHHRKSA